MRILLTVFGLVVLYLLWRAIRLFRAVYSEASADVDRRWAADAQLVEVASWIGRTGLSEEEERELPRYLRREFGEVGAEDALKASDLVYLGVQEDDTGRAHFWSIPNRESGGVYAYACIDIDANGNALSYDWGGREPPQKAPVI